MGVSGWRGEGGREDDGKREKQSRVGIRAAEEAAGAGERG